MAILTCLSLMAAAQQTGKSGLKLIKYQQNWDAEGDWSKSGWVVDGKLIQSSVADQCWQVISGNPGLYDFLPARNFPFNENGGIESFRAEIDIASLPLSEKEKKKYKEPEGGSAEGAIGLAFHFHKNSLNPVLLYVMVSNKGIIRVIRKDYHFQSTKADDLIQPVSLPDFNADMNHHLEISLMNPVVIVKMDGKEYVNQTLPVDYWQVEYFTIPVNGPGRWKLDNLSINELNDAELFTCFSKDKENNKYKNSVFGYTLPVVLTNPDLTLGLRYVELNDQGLARVDHQKGMPSVFLDVMPVDTALLSKTKGQFFNDFIKRVCSSCIGGSGFSQNMTMNTQRKWHRVSYGITNVRKVGYRVVDNYYDLPGNRVAHIYYAYPAVAHDILDKYMSIIIDIILSEMKFE